MRFANSIAPALIVLLGLAVYWAGLSGGFIFDDYANLVRDPDWKATSLSVAELHRAMSLGIASDIGRPLALLTFALNHVFTGLDPFALKFTGLAIHLVNGILVWMLCQRLFRLAPSRVATEAMGDYAAALVAISWVVHPLQVSSVLYVVQRMEVGAHTGVLLALLAYLQGRLAQQSGSTKCWPWFAASLFAMMLGLGFKETALLVPFYALALEIFVLQFRIKNNKHSRILVALYAGGVALGLAAFVLIVLPKYTQEWAYAARHFSLHERILTQPHVLVTYLGKILYPTPDSLLFYYDHFPVSRNLLEPPVTIISVVVLASLMGLAWLARGRWPLFSLGIAWFLSAHALTSNVIPLELAFEHRNYFALLGVMIAGGQLLAAAGARFHIDAKRTLAALPVVLLACLCALQAHTWGDPFRLAIALASRNPDSPRASYDLGQQMMILAGPNHSSPLLGLAAKEFEHSAQLPDSPALAEQALIILKARTGQEVPVEIWIRFREKITHRALGAQDIGSLRSLLDCRIQHQCDLGDQQLLTTFLVALEKNPRSAVLHALYANLAYSVLGDTELAILSSRKAIELDPGKLQYKVNLARLLTRAEPGNPELVDLITTIRKADTHGIYASEFTLSSPPQPQQQ